MQTWKKAKSGVKGQRVYITGNAAVGTDRFMQQVWPCLPEIPTPSWVRKKGVRI